jgi:hypothetical protein
MNLGDRILNRGMRGDDVTELQMRLAGFRGTLWDGDFGPGTELQVITFQRDYMRMSAPTGVIDAPTLTALQKFAAAYPIDFLKLQCECGACGGFGQARFKNAYLNDATTSEAFHRYEYPGMHKAILHAYRGLCFYAEGAGIGQPIITCGYRCWIRNEQKGRTTTNHMGKAIDVDFALQSGDDKRDDCNRCNTVRGLLVEKATFQIGWGAANRKALEPAEIAPSWVHMDVRSFEKRYLQDDFFVTSAQMLDAV